MKVAVIGAGFSGMLAAYLLEKEGIEVTIYEKQEYIGGHCKTLVSKDVYTELGTVCSFYGEIKELLIDLQIDYSERFSYKNFVNQNYHSVEHIPREDVVLLMQELEKLKLIINRYSQSLDSINYGFIEENLLLPFTTFSKKYNLKIIPQVIQPYLSSFGFGNIDKIQAYYVLKVFNVDTLLSFIKGDKLLLITKGTSELINKLSQNISDIRYSLEVKNIEVIDKKVKVETSYDSDFFDKVLITTKLPRDVIKDKLYNQLMKDIHTNPFITCAYEVTNKDLVTTYYKDNLGKEGKIQSFYLSNQNDRTILIAYAYGHESKEVIDNITYDIRQLKIDIKQLITVKQWYIFPHLKGESLTSNFYRDINARQKVSNICLIGSLVSTPSIDTLYLSVKNCINEITHDY